MLGRPRIAGAQRELDSALSKLAQLFAAANYTPVSPPHLYLGETLLSLYGEDLRARAFLFPDAERGNELCLRPDFTVPVAQVHGSEGWDQSGAYSYQGPVFRRQQPGLGRPVEYQQAGIERFGDSASAQADADVMALLLQGLEALGVRSVGSTIGDLSIPFALLDALYMPDRRRSALRRHFWRPGRFQDLLRRAVTSAGGSETRKALLAAANDSDRALKTLLVDAGDMLGARSADEILSRVASLAAEAAEPRMSAADAKLVDTILAVEGPAPEALETLRAVASKAGVNITPALDRFEARLDALAGHGIAVETLHFDASFGRNLEYYDGFVFEIRSEMRGEHPPLAGGGRYDAMTTRLGAPNPVPAVGGMIRPEAVLEVLA